MKLAHAELQGHSVQQYQAGCAHAKEAHETLLASKTAQSESLRTELDRAKKELAVALTQIQSFVTTREALHTELERAGKERVSCASELASANEKVLQLKVDLLRANAEFKEAAKTHAQQTQARDVLTTKNDACLERALSRLAAARSGGSAGQILNPKPKTSNLNPKP